MAKGQGAVVVAPPPEEEAVVGAWRATPDGARPPRRSGLLRLSGLAVVALLVGSWAFVLAEDVALLLPVYLGLVLAVDAVGVGLRRLAR